MKDFGMDPIIEVGGQWYYWDEVWTSLWGPFATKEQAFQDLLRYCYWLDTEEVLRPGYYVEVF